MAVCGTAVKADRHTAHSDANTNPNATDPNRHLKTFIYNGNLPLFNK